MFFYDYWLLSDAFQGRKVTVKMSVLSQFRQVSTIKKISCAFHPDFSGSIADRSKSFTPKEFYPDNPAYNLQRRVLIGIIYKIMY